MAEFVGEGGPEPNHPRAVLGASRTRMRSHNERLILSILRSQGPTAKAGVAQMTGLSAQSASVIMRKLEQEGLIERCPPVRGKVGQPLIPMQLNPGGAYFFGLKVGRRSADLVFTDFLGNILDQERLTYHHPEPDETLRFVQDAVGGITGRLNPTQRDRIAGLGLAIPGYLWEWAKIIGVAPEKMAAWRDRDIREEISAIFDFPVFLQNDASCACGAELVFGNKDRVSDFLYFYVGYFIGGGLVLDNQLFTGPTGNAGALGPMPVPTKEGKLQQLVDIASLVCLEEDLQRAGADPSILWESPQDWSLEPDLLNHWLEQSAKGLAYAITTVCSVVDFKHVVIDGWLPDAVRRRLVDMTADAMPGLNWAGLIRPEVREGTIGPEARSLGAASLPLSKRFLVSKYDD